MKSITEELKYKTVISWGGYEYLRSNIDALRKVTQLDYICGDKRYVKVAGYRIIEKEEILRLKDPFVIISQTGEEDIRTAADWCIMNKVPFTHLSFAMADGILNSKYIIALGGTYTDYKNNTVTISPEADGEIVIDTTQAEKADVQIGKIHVKGRLNIAMNGTGGTCRIGNGSSFVRVHMGINTDGCIEIGDDCMFSHQISLLQSDMHMIFDAETGERINYAKPIRIGNHVWVGREAELLGGAEIGDNSVVGARTVTAGRFPKNVIIAGSPAKVIREGVIWTRDLIENGSKDRFEDCRDQAALKYMDSGRQE